jgi:hypothetical protein
MEAKKQVRRVSLLTERAKITPTSVLYVTVRERVRMNTHPTTRVEPTNYALPVIKGEQYHPYPNDDCSVVYKSDMH